MNNNDTTEEEKAWGRELDNERRRGQQMPPVEANRAAGAESQGMPDRLEDMKEEKRAEQELRKDQQSEREGRMKQAIKKKAAQALAQKAATLAKLKKMKSLRDLLLIVKGASGVTVIGLIVTFAIILIQGILVYVIGIKWLPPLSWIEKIVFWILIALFIFLFLLIMVLIYFIAHPCDVARVIGSWWAELLGEMCETLTGTGSSGGAGAGAGY